MKSSNGLEVSLRLDSGLDLKEFPRKFVRETAQPNHCTTNVVCPSDLELSICIRIPQELREDSSNSILINISIHPNDLTRALQCMTIDPGKINELYEIGHVQRTLTDTGAGEPLPLVFQTAFEGRIDVQIERGFTVIPANFLKHTLAVKAAAKSDSAAAEVSIINGAWFTRRMEPIKFSFINTSEDWVRDPGPRCSSAGKSGPICIQSTAQTQTYQVKTSFYQTRRTSRWYSEGTVERRSPQFPDESRMSDESSVEESDEINDEDFEPEIPMRGSRQNGPVTRNSYTNAGVDPALPNNVQSTSARENLNTGENRTLPGREREELGVKLQRLNGDIRRNIAATQRIDAKILAFDLEIRQLNAKQNSSETMRKKVEISIERADAYDEAGIKMNEKADMMEKRIALRRQLGMLQ